MRRIRIAAVALSALVALSSLVGLCDSARFHFHQPPPPINLEFDPYVVLGVSRRASPDEIKSAYRQKARDTHPDKNPDVDPEVSSELFRKVAEAFEVLGDDQKRRRYDRQYEAERRREREAAQRRRQQEQMRKRQEEQRRKNEEELRKRREDVERRIVKRLKNRPEVRSAQSGVTKVSSLDQLRTLISLDRSGRLAERDLLMVFVGNKNVENIVDDVLLFPYPFAGTGGAAAENSGEVGGVRWDDVLRSAKVRYNKPSELTKFFRAPSNKEMRAVGDPHIVFVRKGDRLDQFSVYHYGSNDGVWNKREHLEKWVRSQLETMVAFVNRHRHKVELLQTDGSHRSASLVATISPGGTHVHRTATVGDEFVARDWRVDKFPGGARDFKITEKSSLGRYTVKERNGRIVVEGRVCVDMSGHCDEWAAAGSCDEMAEFMGGVCASTCRTCNQDGNGDGNVSKSPLSFLRRLTSLTPSGSLTDLVEMTLPRTLTKDLTHILDFRKNAVCTIALLGFGLGLLLSAMFRAEKATTSPTLKQNWQRRLEKVAFLAFVVFPSLCLASSLAVRVPPRHVVRHNPILLFMCVYAVDVKHVVGFQKNAAAAVLCFFVLIGMVVGSVAGRALHGKPRRRIADVGSSSAGKVVSPPEGRRGGGGGGSPGAFGKTATAATAILTGFLCLSAALVFAFDQVRSTIEDGTFVADMDHVLAFRKNAAFTVAAFGIGVGVRSALLVGGMMAARGRGSSKRQRSLNVLERLVEVTLVFLPLCCFLGTTLLGRHSTRNRYESGMTRFMRMYRADLAHVAAYRKNAAAAIFVVSLVFGLMLGMSLVLKHLLVVKQDEQRRQKNKMKMD